MIKILASTGYFDGEIQRLTEVPTPVRPRVKQGLKESTTALVPTLRTPEYNGNATGPQTLISRIKDQSYSRRFFCRLFCYAQLPRGNAVPGGLRGQMKSDLTKLRRKW